MLLAMLTRIILMERFKDILCLIIVKSKTIIIVILLPIILVSYYDVDISIY